MKNFQRLKNLKIDIRFLQFSILALIVLSALQVLTRYLLNAPLSWTEEVSTWFLIWMTFVGAYSLLNRDAHARVEIIDEFFGKRTARWLHTFWDSVIGFSWWFWPMPVSGSCILSFTIKLQPSGYRMRSFFVLSPLPLL